MRVWLDPIRLAARQLTAGDVVNALREQNVNVAAGSVGDSPAREGQTYQISVRAAGRLRESGEFENVIVKTGARRHARAPCGRRQRRARRRDLFVAAPLPGRRRRRLRRPRAADGQRARRAARRHRRRWPGCARAFPPGLEYRIAFDTTTVVQESIAEVVETLLIAIGLVVLVMFVFLQSWRATLIPALTMPVSLIGAFAFVNLLDFSINTLTLFAIVLATGIVVDDAIVVIENVERHIQELQQVAAAGGVRRDARGVRRGHRHGARADRRVRAGRLLSRARPAVSISSSR